MAKRRDFLDYVDLGAGLVQATNSTAIRDHLNALSQLEAEKLSVAQREAALQQREIRTRDFVFDGTHLIGDLKGEAVGNPRRSLVLFYELRRYVQLFGISTTAVRTYEDKERTHQFLKALQEAIADCESKLDPQAREEAEKCESFRAEQPDLDDLIQFETTRTQLETLNSELAALGPLSRPVLPLPLSLAIICVGILLFLIASARGFEPSDLTAGVCVILGLIVFPLGILMLRSKTPPSAEALDLKERIENESNLLKGLLDGRDLQDWSASLQRKFGHGDANSYRRISKERNQLVTRIMKQE